MFLVLALRVLLRTTKRKASRKEDTDVVHLVRCVGKAGWVECIKSMVEVSPYTFRTLLRGAIVLLPLLGLTWIFGILTLDRNTTVFAWIFTFLNSLQVS